MKWFEVTRPENVWGQVKKMEVRNVGRGLLCSRISSLSRNQQISMHRSIYTVKYNAESGDILQQNIDRLLLTQQYLDFFFFLENQHFDYTIPFTSMFSWVWYRTGHFKMSYFRFYWWTDSFCNCNKVLWGWFVFVFFFMPFSFFILTKFLISFLPTWFPVYMFLTYINNSCNLFYTLRFICI